MAALDVVRFFNLSLLVAYYLACGVNGCFAAVLSYVALRVARFGRPLMCGVLNLPMTLSIFFSASQVASAIVFSTLLFALVSYYIARPPTSVAGYCYAIAWLAVLGCFFSVNRPTYRPIFLVLLSIPRPITPPVLSSGPGEPRFSFWRSSRLPGPWWPLVVGGILASGAAITLLIALGHGSTTVAQPSASMHGQLLIQLEQPGSALGVVVRSIVDGGRNWMEMFFGQLGWNGGGPFPGSWAHLALGVGVVGLALCGGETAHMVVGSRWLGRGDYGSTASHRVGMRLESALVKWKTGCRITYPTSGFRATSRAAIRLCSRTYPTDFPKSRRCRSLRTRGRKWLEFR